MKFKTRYNISMTRWSRISILCMAVWLSACASTPARSPASSKPIPVEQGVVASKGQDHVKSSAGTAFPFLGSTFDRVGQTMTQDSEPFRVMYTRSLAQCQVAVTEARQNKGGSLEEFLRRCDFIRDQIVWEEPNGSLVVYNDWSRSKKNRLIEFFNRLIHGDSDLGVNCPGPNSSYVDQYQTFFYTYDQAFDMFAVHVAHALYLELTGRVPWSLLDRPSSELEEFFGSYRYQMIIPSSFWTPVHNNNLPKGIAVGRDYQTHGRLVNLPYELNCDPRVGYGFVTGANSTDHVNRLGSTRDETMANLTWFFSSHVAHGPLPDTNPSEDQRLYRYRREHPNLKDRLRLYTVTRDFGGALNPAIVVHKGCHSAASLFYDLAKSVNIPTLVVGTMEWMPVLPDSGYSVDNAHAGLVYDWGFGRGRIVEHADNMNAQGHGNHFTIQADGSAVPESEMPRHYFEYLWQRIPSIRSWGFNFNNNLRPPVRGDRYTNHVFFNNSPQVRVFAGYWPSQTESDGTVSHDAYVPYQNDRHYHFCDWAYFMRYYCAGATGIPMPETHVSFSPLRVRTPEERMDHAEACAAAYGGCRAVQDRADIWTRGFGNVGWAD